MWTPTHLCALEEEAEGELGVVWAHGCDGLVKELEHLAAVHLPWSQA